MIELNANLHSWEYWSLEDMLLRIQNENCPIVIKRYGYDFGCGQCSWSVECGHAPGRASHLDLNTAIKEAYAIWETKRPKYEKQQIKRAKKAAEKEAMQYVAESIDTGQI